MNKNKSILKLNISKRGRILSVEDKYETDYLPPCVRYDDHCVDVDQLDEWWSSRSIPASRPGFQENLLRLNLELPSELVLKCLGLSLSDQYWLNPDSRLSWDKVNFFTNSFSEDVGDILCGKMVNGNIDLMSPNNTSDGWLKKKWKIINGERYLLKGGSRPALQEPINELIATRLMERMPAHRFVKYHIIRENNENYCACPNFVTPDTEYIPAIHAYRAGEQDLDTGSYKHLMNMCTKLGIPDIQPVMDYMLSVDYLMGNEDRHFGNFGFIRNVETLEYQGMAPIFDTGSSLYYKSFDEDIRLDADIGVKPFALSQEQQLYYVSSFRDIDISAIRDFPEEMREIFRKYGSHISERRIGKLCQVMGERIEQMEIYVRLSKQGLFKQVEKYKNFQNTYIPSGVKKFEKELFKNEFMPTETILSGIKQINTHFNSEISLKEFCNMYKDLDSVPEPIRDTVMQVGNELKRQELLQMRDSNIME